jgi:hypothetical protein
VTVITNCWDIVFSIVTMCGLDNPGYKSWQGQEISTWVLSGEKSERGMKLISHLHIVPRLRMRGAVSLRPLDAFMAQTGTNLPFYLHVCILDVCCIFVYDVLYVMSKIF